MADTRRRDPYVILSLQHGAPRDRIGRAFARASVAIRQGRSSWQLEDLTWAKQEAERAAEDPEVAEGYLRLPANPEALELQGGSSLLTPVSTPLSRRTLPLQPEDIARIEQDVLNEAAIALLADEPVFTPAAATWIMDAITASLETDDETEVDPFRSVSDRNRISKDTTEQDLRFRATDPDPAARAAVAALSVCPLDLVESLAVDADASVRAAVMGSSAVPLDLLLGAARDPAAPVRAAAAGNHQLPVLECEQLVTDSNAGVAKRARTRLIKHISEGCTAEEASRFSQSVDPKVRAAAAGSPTLPVRVLVTLLSDTDAKVADAASIAIAPRLSTITDSAILGQVADAASAEPVLTALARNHRTPSGALDKIALLSETVQEIVANNPSTSTSTLKRIRDAGASRARIRAAAAITDRTRGRRRWILLAIGAASAAVVAAFIAMSMVNQASESPDTAVPSATAAPAPAPAPVARAKDVKVVSGRKQFTVSWQGINVSKSQEYRVEFKSGTSPWTALVDDAGREQPVQGTSTVVNIRNSDAKILQKVESFFRVAPVTDGATGEWATSPPVKLKKGNG